MTRRTLLPVGCVYAIGLALAVATGVTSGSLHTSWTLPALLIALATAVQIFSVEAPNHRLFYATPIFFFAGALLLPPPRLLALVVVPYVAEWLRDRYVGRSRPDDIYRQTFTMAVSWIAARAAQELFTRAHGDLSVRTGRELAIVLAAGLVYVLLDGAIAGAALPARGGAWSDWSVLDAASLTGEYVLICMGSVFAALWVFDPPFIVPALAPLALIYRALAIPQLEREAQTDAKTGLYNARYFALSFGAELGRALRFERPLAVLMADLDLLRNINNSHGHLAGDTVLEGIAGIIRSTMREYDVAGRFGGEEFSLVLPETDESQARTIAERLRQRIEATPFRIGANGIPLHVTMSIGVACYPGDGKTSTELMHEADRAVYVAKAKGRNLVVCTSDIAGTVPSPFPAAPVPPGAVTDRLPIEEEPGSVSPFALQDRPWLQLAFMGAVIATGLATIIWGVLFVTPTALQAILPLVLLAGAAELLEIDLLGRGTLSIGAAIAFTAAVLSGLPGLICVSVVVSLVHHLKQRRPLAQAYRAVFNTSIHVLAGLVVVAVFGLQHRALEVRSLPVLMLLTICAAVGYFVVETGLVATALSIQEGKNPVDTWRTQYGWLVTHYVVLFLIGLVLCVTYTEMGLLSAMLLALPLFMMHYVQKQHMEQTRKNSSALQPLERKPAWRSAVESVLPPRERLGDVPAEAARAVRRFLADREVAVLVQPIWDLGHGTLLGYEALARFPRREGFGGPREAFDVADRIGISVELDTMCLEAALVRAAELPPDTLLFVNVLAETLEGNCLSRGTVLHALIDAGLRPEQVVFEFNEGAISRLDALIGETERLRALGFKLALDDAGTGKAGLEMLDRLQVDFVKIDCGVALRTRADDAARAVLAGTIAMALEMDASVIAEGIETMEALELVCDVVLPQSVEGGNSVLGIQGYLLHRPEPEFLLETVIRDDPSESEDVIALLLGMQDADGVGMVAR